VTSRRRAREATDRARPPTRPGRHRAAHASRVVRDRYFEYYTTGHTSRVWRNVYCENVAWIDLWYAQYWTRGLCRTYDAIRGGASTDPAGSRRAFRLFATHDESNRNMLNADGENVDLYIPRKCSWTNRLITASDKASVQLNVGHLDANGVYNGSYTTMALSGYVRMKVRR